MKRVLPLLMMCAVLTAGAVLLRGQAPEGIYASEAVFEEETESIPESPATGSLKEEKKQEVKETEEQNINGAEAWRNFERRMDQIAIDTEPEEEES